jgi:YggT family protein
MNTQSNTIKNTNPASFGKWALGVIKTRNASLLLLVLVISTTLTILQPRFLSQGNLSSVLIGMAYTLPIALGMTLVMILGGIDLSPLAALLLLQLAKMVILPPLHELAGLIG